jgi:hypothetical protein
VTVRDCVKALCCNLAREGGSGESVHRSPVLCGVGSCGSVHVDD